jgi:hypothetical protein
MVFWMAEGVFNIDFPTAKEWGLFAQDTRNVEEGFREAVVAIRPTLPRQLDYITTWTDVASEATHPVPESGRDHS